MNDKTAHRLDGQMKADRFAAELSATFDATDAWFSMQKLATIPQNETTPARLRTMSDAQLGLIHLVFIWGIAELTVRKLEREEQEESA